MRHLIMSLIISLVGTGFAQAQSEILLRLSYLVDGEAQSSITVYGNAIDPNVISADDRYRVEIDGRRVALNDGFVRRTAAARRGFSYDHFTGGITVETAGPICSMGGPAEGWILETRYLDYEDFRIVGDQLRAVYSEGNCLFRPLVRPVEEQALTAAAGVFSRLQTALELQ